MEFGVGIHGEPGRRRDKVQPAQEITNELLGAIIEDLKQKIMMKFYCLLMVWVDSFTELYLLYHNAKNS